MSTVKVNAITDASGGNTATINSMTPTADSLQGFRNRIINGGMVIDQRNAGASVTVNSGTNTFGVDRWKGQASGGGVYTQQRSTTAPAGFTNSVLLTVTTADSSIASTDYYIWGQAIEGFNAADFGWGTANAQTVTLSFWVRSSITGTYALFVGNNGDNRSLVSTFTISAANTWEQKTVTIAGDTSGTWATDNSIGIGLWFTLGAGSSFNATANVWNASLKFNTSASTNWIATNGATFYITGVQLEVGSTATPFERRPYGTELMLCQRYCYGQNNSGGQAYYWFGTSAGTSSSTAYGMVQFPVTMRTKPTVTLSAAGTFFLDPNVINFTSASLDQAGVNGGAIGFSGGSGMTAGYCGRFLSDNTDAASIIWSAEL